MPILKHMLCSFNLSTANNNQVKISRLADRLSRFLSPYHALILVHDPESVHFRSIFQLHHMTTGLLTHITVFGINIFLKNSASLVFITTSLHHRIFLQPPTSIRLQSCLRTREKEPLIWTLMTRLTSISRMALRQN